MEHIKELSDYLETIDGYTLWIACNDRENTALFQGNKKTKIKMGLQLEAMREFYHSGDILYFPTRYEGFSMSTLEALSCGIPVIGSEFAAPEELRAYDFVEVIEDMPVPEILTRIASLVERCKNRKQEIHEIITRDFGREQYAQKLFRLLADRGADRKVMIIVSLCGIGSAGGVERVCYYLHEILKKRYAVKVMTKTKMSFGKLDTLIQPLLLSLRLIFIRNKIVFANSWQAFLYPVDFSLHHGTTKGFTERAPEERSVASVAISVMEKISAWWAKRVLAVSQSAAREIVSLYGAPAKKITVLNNFVDESIFYPDL